MILLAEYDIAAPPSLIWGVEGHTDALLLITRCGRPLDILHIVLDPYMGALTRERIERAIVDHDPSLLYRRATTDDDVRPVRDQPPISVVVCTRERPRSLQRCLAALQRLDYLNYEVVVVDNASRDDATRRIVAATPFRYVRENTPGLDWARNRGVAEARYDLIAYCDDDAHVSPNWLAAIANAFADSTVAAVTGLVLPMELTTRAQRLFEHYGHGMSKGLRPRRFCGAQMPNPQLIKVQDVGVGANLAVRRAAFDAIGGFDTALDVGTPAQGGGDLDFFHRLLAAGMTIQYEPAAWMRHQHRRDIDALREQLYSNGRAYGTYLHKLYATQRLPRQDVLRFALGWSKWLIGRSVRAIFTKKPLPRAMVWAELIGALHSPRAYRATLREDARRRALGTVPSLATPL